jgi:hypothetical protein
MMKRFLLALLCGVGGAILIFGAFALLGAAALGIAWLCSKSNCTEGGVYILTELVMLFIVLAVCLTVSEWRRFGGKHDYTRRDG